MFEVTGNLDDSTIQASLTALAFATGRTQGEILRDRTPTLARYLAESTQPVAAADTSNPDGGSLRARDMGRAAVRRDIGRVYLSTAKIYQTLKNWSNAKVGAALARQFYARLKKGDIAGAKEILRRSGISAQNLDIQNWDNGTLHKRSRNARGQVNKGRKPVIITDQKSLRDYVKKKEKKVGFVKSGWITAGRQIKSGGRTAAWLTQAAPGTGLDKTANTEFPMIHLTDLVSYASSAIRNRYESAATAAFMRSLVKETNIVLSKNAAKEQARANSKK